jgi:hypothetical protein
VRFDGQAASVAVWDGKNWSSLWDFDYDNGSIYALAWFDETLFIGGGFDEIGKLDIHTVAQRKDEQWAAVGSGFDGGNDFVDTLVSIDDGLYASGHFTETDGKPANGLARWTGSDWEPINLLETEWEGPPISAADGDLYVGPFPRIHRWDRSEWRTLGADVNGEARVVLGPDAVYAAGSFTAIGRHGAGRITRWLSCEDTEERCATTTTSTTTTTTTTTVTTTSTTLPTTTTSSMPTSSSSTSSTTTIPEYCGDANHDGDVTASDALAALRTAVGLPQCELLDCDIDGNFAVTANDALAVLRMAVGFVIPGACPHG